MGEDRPVEWLLSTATQLTPLVGETDCIFGVGYGSAVVVDPTIDSGAILEIDQALSEIGGDDREEEEREENEGFETAGPCHGLYIGGVGEERGMGSLCRSTRPFMRRRVRHCIENAPRESMPF